MTPVETVLVLAVIPLAIYGVIALLTLREKFARSPRYRPGQEWEHPPVWWTANPGGLGAGHPVLSAGGHSGGHSTGAHSADVHSAEHADSALVRTAKGGARGSW
ncbi:hypothetical protein L6E12_15005 [Actinokineospora sp. PR83]|uniref:aa3-type cytochrome oxidase subunit CtaJ n=1 Tax=Actinokineospora sp. PR83 TaxID=2884908 RepID=UPI0027DFE79B|nr:hypothetical protein [Actinokineospora sp. PR83]MCG8917098.1 hypothetical protein [Actinokineospora sp. PR83]